MFLSLYKCFLYVILFYMRHPILCMLFLFNFPGLGKVALHFRSQRERRGVKFNSYQVWHFAGSMWHQVGLRDKQGNKCSSKQATNSEPICLSPWRWFVAKWEITSLDWISKQSQHIKILLPLSSLLVMAFCRGAVRFVIVYCIKSCHHLKKTKDFSDMAKLLHTPEETNYPHRSK